jgi:RND family efflux transporter MFP subunit
MKLSAKSELAVVALGLTLFALAGGAVWWAVTGGGAAAQKGPPRERAITVVVATAARKDMPFRVDAIGMVQPIVSVQVRSRVDSQIEKVHFEDGASVKGGDVLFTLDSRAIDAQISQAEATLTRDKAQLEKAQRDLERITALAEKNAVSKVQLADARTNVDVLKATIAQDEAILQNMRVLRTYYDIQSPATGRMSISGVRPGAVVRASDSAPPLATVNQISPIYVAFGVPERYIPDLRAAGDKATVEVTLQSELVVGGGRVAFIENTVDPQTATIMVRATFDNKDEGLWPGAVVSARVTLRLDRDVVVVPSEAIQSGQRGTFVFVVEKETAKVRAVNVSRTQDGEAIVADGLAAGETVVTDGHLSLRDGSRIEIKRPAGA